MPALGRMRLWESFTPASNKLADDILKTMRHSWMAVPFLPAAAFAADMKSTTLEKLTNKVADLGTTMSDAP